MLPTNPLLNATAPAGPHLPLALLRQYAAGTLAPAAQHRVEAHTLACSRCADILAGLLQTPAATTDQALAQLQQRLRQRVQQAAPARPLVAAPRRHRWLAPQLAAAAALILGLVAAGWWTWQQRQRAPATVAAHYPIIRPSQPAAPAAATNPTLGNEHVPAMPSGAITGRKRSPAMAEGARAGGKHAQTIARNTLGGGKRLPTATKITATASGDQTAAAAAPTPDTSPAQSLAPDSATPASWAATPTAPVAPPPVAAVAPAREAAARLRATMPAPPALPASPSGGYAALREYLKKGAAEFVPESKDGPRQTGRVLVRLHLGANGKIEQAEAVRKLRPDYDAEAVRLLQAGPAWVPGIGAGRRAAQVVEVPVVFEERPL